MAESKKKASDKAEPRKRKQTKASDATPETPYTPPEKKAKATAAKKELAKAGKKGAKANKVKAVQAKKDKAAAKIADNKAAAAHYAKTGELPEAATLETPSKPAPVEPPPVAKTIDEVVLPRRPEPPKRARPAMEMVRVRALVTGRSMYGALRVSLIKGEEQPVSKEYADILFKAKKIEFV